MMETPPQTAPIQVRQLLVRFSGRIEPWEVPALRGAIGQKVGADAVLFHHHQGDSLRYSYPLIQYKRLGKSPAILCLGPGVDDIHKFFSQPDWSLRIGHKHLPMRIEELSLRVVEVGFANEPIAYSLRNWVAVNQDTFPAYRSLKTREERAAFLQRKLTGNMLSFAKGINWHVDQNIEVEIDTIEAAPNVRIKGVEMANFHVSFRSNLSLPDYIGLGGKPSIGMGMLYRADSGFRHQGGTTPPQYRVL